MNRIALIVLIVCMLLSGCAAPTQPHAPAGDADSTSSSITVSSTDPIKGQGTAAINSDKKELNVLDFGVDNTGVVDATDILTKLHASGKRIYYPNGTYRFNGKTLDLSGGVRFESQDGVLVRNSLSDTNILNFDDKGNLIGLMQNHLEYKCGHKNNTGFQKIGSLASPPLSTANYKKRAEVLPYWYNDFGLHTRFATPSGGITWYDWSWNHHSAGGDGYDPTLHPLLGWYFGDDPVVLDWICYWLREYGMDQAALTAAGIDEDPAGGHYWVYQLLHNTPNAKNMDFALWMTNRGYGETMETYREGWWGVFEAFYFDEQYKDQVYCYVEDGKRYGVIWLWDERGVRYSLDRNSQGSMHNTAELYKQVAQAFQEHGYDGVCVMPRYGCMPAMRVADMEQYGVKWFGVSYPQNSAGSGSTYAERVENFKTVERSDVLYGVATGMNTHTPHPSNWNCPGNTPELFGKWLKKAVDATVSDDARTAKIITCYNVSEWAEGGPGLIPTVADRFGYLEAIRDAIVISG